MNDLAIERSHPVSDPVMLPPELQSDYAELRRLSIFDGLPNAELAQLMTAGRIRRLALERDVLVVDPIGLAEGRPAPVGETGRLLVRGASQTPGYYQRPELYAEWIVAGEQRTEPPASTQG